MLRVLLCKRQYCWIHCETLIYFYNGDRYSKNQIRYQTYEFPVDKIKGGFKKRILISFSQIRRETYSVSKFFQSLYLKIQDLLDSDRILVSFSILPYFVVLIDNRAREYKNKLAYNILKVYYNT